MDLAGAFFADFKRFCVAITPFQRAVLRIPIGSMAVAINAILVLKSDGDPHIGSPEFPAKS